MSGGLLLAVWLRAGSAAGPAPWQWFETLPEAQRQQLEAEILPHPDLCDACAGQRDGRHRLPLQPFLVANGSGEALCASIDHLLSAYGVAVVPGAVDEATAAALAAALDLGFDTESSNVIAADAEVELGVLFRYLPEFVGEQRVLTPAAAHGSYVVKNDELEAATGATGIAYRLQADGEKDVETDFPEFGSVVQGRLADGWLRVAVPQTEWRQVRFNAPLALAASPQVEAFQAALGRLGPCYARVLGARAPLKEFAAMVANPGAQAQYVHPDLAGPTVENPDRHRMLSTYLYARAVELDQGALDVWLGTHDVAFSQLRAADGRPMRAAETLPHLSPSVRVAPVQAGSAVLFFGHLLHRGSANSKPPYGPPLRLGKRTRSSLYWTFMTEKGSDPGERIAYELESTFTMLPEYKDQVSLETAMRSDGIYAANERPQHINRGCKRCHSACSTCMSFKEVQEECSFANCASCPEGSELVPLQQGDAGMVGRCVLVTSTSRGCAHCHRSCETCAYVAEDPSKQPDACGSSDCTSCRSGREPENGRCHDDEL